MVPQTTCFPCPGNGRFLWPFGSHLRDCHVRHVSEDMLRVSTGASSGVTDLQIDHALTAKKSWGGGLHQCRHNEFVRPSGNRFPIEGEAKNSWGCVGRADQSMRIFCGHSNCSRKSSIRGMTLPKIGCPNNGRWVVPQHSVWKLGYSFDGISVAGTFTFGQDGSQMIPRMQGSQN